MPLPEQEVSSRLALPVREVFAFLFGFNFLELFGKRIAIKQRFSVDRGYSAAKNFFEQLYFRNDFP